MNKTMYCLYITLRYIVSFMLLRDTTNALCRLLAQTSKQKRLPIINVDFFLEKAESHLFGRYVKSVNLSEPKDTDIPPFFAVCFRMHSAPLNAFAGFERPLQGGGKRQEKRKGWEKERGGRKHPLPPK